MAVTSFEDLGDGVAGLAAGHVDGVGAAPAGRQLRVDGVAQVVGKGNEVERRAADGVGGHATPSADGGHHHDVGAGGQRLGGEGGRGLERLLHSGAARAGLAHGTVEDAVLGGRVRRCGYAAARAPAPVAPPLTSTTRLLAVDGPDPVVEAAAVAHVLDVGEGDLGGDRRRRTRGSRPMPRAAALPALTARATPMPVCTE